MNHHVPQPDPAQTNFEMPMVYIRKQIEWEYKQLVRDLTQEAPPTEEELNALGAEGWELSGLLQRESLAYFYFKRETA